MAGRVRSLMLVAGVIATMIAPRGAPAASPTHYVEMPDGIRIAVNVQLPSGTMPAEGWPTIIQIDGYGGASVPMNPNGQTFGNGNYATAHMSLRGTGCSGGRFDLFDRVSAEDGYRVIEWIADQTWSNDKVAIWGHSYSGLTGWLVASTQPPSLVAMSVSGLIDDLYRGIVFMGGVSNLGFPLIWTGAYRPANEYQYGVVPGLQAGDPVCAANQAGRVPPDVMDNPILNGVMALGEDGQWWRSHSTITYLDGINVPIHIVQSYQDEQTGPRGSNLLWQRLDERKPTLPKRLLLTNGVHSTNTNPAAIRDDRVAWLDCYVRGVCSADILDPNARVKVFWEMHVSPPAASGVLSDPDWPLSVTSWTRYLFGPNGGLSADPSSVGGSPDAYVAGSKRAGAWSYLPASGGYNVQAGSNFGHELTNATLPDEVRYVTAPFPTDTAIAGPIDVTLYASSTAPDTEFYVELNDVDGQGNMTRLQRGLLKASHREIDPAFTDYTANGEIIRPHHPHTNTATNLLVPGEPTQFEIEVFPLGHVFRAGHKLLVRVTTPPISDALAFYVPTTGGGVNQIFHDAAHPSSILLPVVPMTNGSLGSEVPCGQQVGLERCTKPIN